MLKNTEDINEAKCEMYCSRLELIKSIISRIISSSGGVACYPTSVVSTFLCIFIDKILCSNCPSTIPHQVPTEMNFFQPTVADANSKYLSQNGHSSLYSKSQGVVSKVTSAINNDSDVQVFRKLSAANTLLPYDPFPTISNQLITSDSPKDRDLLFELRFRQSQRDRVNAPAHLPAPSLFEDKFYATRLKEMEIAIKCSHHTNDLLYRVIFANQNYSKTTDSDRRIGYLVDLLIERAIPCSIFIPTDDQYRVCAT